MRDLMFAMAMLIVIPLAFARPLNAYLMWCWTAVLIPTSYFFGFMADARLNFLFAILTLSMVVLGRIPLGPWAVNRVTWLYLVFLVHATLAFALGLPNNPFNAQYFELLVKAMVFCLVMPLFIRERWHLHVMLLVIALGLGMHGVINGLKVLASLGAHNVYGPAGTMIDDRNHLATALAICLPILFYLHLHSAKRLIRWAFLGAFGLVALAILGSGSRAGFIAVSIVVLWMLLTVRNKGMVLLLGIVLAAVFLSFAPEHWTARLSTIKEAQEDASFLGRVIAWNASSALALEHPIFGGGFHAIQAQQVWDQFKSTPGLLSFLQLPTPTPLPKAAHSIYFEVLGDLGFVGLMIFLVILGQALLARFQIRRLVGSSGGRYVWARDMADALMVAIVAYMVGGASVSLAYFEVMYMLVMLMELLRLNVRRELAVQLPLDRAVGAA